MDQILYWNDVALEANKVSHTNGKGEQTGPTLSSRALAIAHLAMYDAYAGAAPGGLPLYLVGLVTPPPAGSASPEAAIAAAAHAALSKLFPSQKPFFDRKHLEAGLVNTVPPAKLQAGHQFGLQVAAALLDLRKGDPGAGDDGYAASMARGAHRVDPDNPTQGFHAPFYGSGSSLFATEKRHSLDPPPFDDAEYLAALREVRGKGIAPELLATLPPAIDKRTPGETVIGLFWGYDGARDLGTPPRLYNQIVRDVAKAQGNDTAKNARLFAFVNAAMADAGILAWEEKYRHDFWRPVVGIREHDPSMGPAAGVPANALPDVGDAGWLPLGAPKTNDTGLKNFTPPFPAYPSGHATFGAAAFHVTRLFYGVPAGDRAADNLFDGLAFVSDELNGMNADNKGAVRPRHLRGFPDGLWRMILENGLSRVFLGVHWVFDAFTRKPDGSPNLERNVGGVPLGLAIAEDMFSFGGGVAPKRSSS